MRQNRILLIIAYFNCTLSSITKLLPEKISKHSKNFGITNGTADILKLLTNRYKQNLYNDNF